MASTFTFTVPKEYGYVIVVASTTYFASFWQGFLSARLRAPTGLKVPLGSADSGHIAAAADDPKKKKALYLYNCAVRAHGNYLENQPSVLAALLISGLQYPVVASALGGVWVVARIAYALGYVSKDKTAGEARLPGFFVSLLAQMSLFGLSTWSGVKLLL